MTLKHIQFNDSPVMRELARQAVKNGTIAAQDVSELVRIAAAKKGESHAPSGDLFADMVRLADGLRSKGYVRNAEVLEEKLLAYKLASSELDKTLTEAHPEGDVEIEDAEDDLGTIETLESLHERIMEAVRAKPTAKQAMVQNILKIASEILKDAQDAQAAAPAGGADARQDFGNDRLNRINKLNELVDSAHALAAKIEGAAAAIPSEGFFTEQNVMEKLPQFITFIGSERAGMVNSFVQSYRYIYGDGPINSQTVYDKLSSLSVPQQIVYCAHADKSIFEKYLKSDEKVNLGPKSFLDKAHEATKPVTDVMNKAIEMGTSTPVAMYNLYQGAHALADTKTKAAAAEIDAVMQQRYKSIFNSTTIGTANTGAKNAVDFLKSKAMEIATALRIEKLPLTAMSNGPVLAGLNRAAFLVKAMIGSEEVYDAYTKLNSLIPIGLLGEIKNTIQSELIRLLDAASGPGLTLSPSDAVVSDIQGIASKLERTLSIVAEWISNNGGENSEKGAKYVPVKNKIGTLVANLQTALSENTRLSSAELMKYITKTMPALSNVNELREQVDVWFEAAKGLVATSSAKNDLSKFGGPVGLDGKPTASKAAPPGGTGTAAPAGQAAPKGQAGSGLAGIKFKPEAKVQPGTGRIMGTLEESEKDIVKQMQTLMVAIADKKGRADLKAVGKDGGPDPDGAWGPGSGTILRAIQQLMTADKFQGKLWTGPTHNLGFGGTDKAEQYAKHNIDLLTKYLQSIGGTVPNGQNPQAAKNPLLGVVPGLEHAPLHYLDIASLSGMYEYIKRTGVEELMGQDAQGNELTGLISKAFLALMSTLNKWFQEMTAEDSSYSGYAQAFQNRMREFSALIKKHSLSQNSLVTKQMVSAPAANSGASKGETGAGYVIDPATGNKVPAKPGQIDEGRNVPMGNDSPPPFMDNGDIDLSLPYYNAIARTVGERVLSQRAFRAYPSEQLAYAFFNDGRNASAKDSFKGFLEYLSKSLNRAVRMYSYSDAAPSEKKFADDKNIQWQDAIAYLRADSRNW